MTPDIVEKYKKIVAQNLEKGDIVRIAKKTGLKYMNVYFQVTGRRKLSKEVIDATVDFISEKKKKAQEIIDQLEV